MQQISPVNQLKLEILGRGVRLRIGHDGLQTFFRKPVATLLSNAVSVLSQLRARHS